MEIFTPFYIDDGELSGVAVDKAFVLGVEWQLFRSNLARGGEFEQDVHVENVERLRLLVLESNRGIDVYPVDESWTRMHVPLNPRLVLVPPC